MIPRILHTGLLAMATCVAASAAELPSRHILPLPLASEATMAAVAACEKMGFHVTATVVDAYGQTRSVSKADLAGPHTVDSSRLKAYTAVSLGPTFNVNNTGEVAAKASASPSGAALAAVPGFMLFAGGILIKSQNEVLGGIGVGGAGNGDQDQICAQSALDQIGARLQ